MVTFIYIILEHNLYSVFATDKLDLLKKNMRQEVYWNQIKHE